MEYDFKLSNYQETGFCRINFEAVNGQGQKVYYCLQDDYGIQLYRQTDDYREPSHVVTPKAFIHFERPPITCDLTKKVNEWIDDHERKFRKDLT
jgi:hypothetical protein